ncbi:MAG: hypothetical protein ACU83N_15055 [Gammaproteobacteria bacterium]
MSRKTICWIVSIIVTGLLALTSANAQDSIDDILEKARAKAQKIEKVKKILNQEPDQNVRLAAFDLLIQNGDPVEHEVALEAGLASADKLLQSAAFKEAIMSLDRLHLILKEAPDTPAAMQQLAKAYIEKNGDQHVIVITKKDRKTGTFEGNHLRGEVIGTHLTFTDYHAKGTLFLKDDDSLTGEITLTPGREAIKFSASGKIR